MFWLSTSIQLDHTIIEFALHVSANESTLTLKATTIGRSLSRIAERLNGELTSENRATSAFWRNTAYVLHRMREMIGNHCPLIGRVSQELIV